MKSKEEFLSKLKIYSNTVGACLDHVILSHLLEDSVVRDRVIVSYELPKELYTQIVRRQKIILIQYICTVFDKSAFHLKKFKTDYEDFFVESQVLDDVETVLKLHSYLEKDIQVIRNNIASHSSYDTKGQEKGYKALLTVEDFDLDLIICFLRLIDVKFRITFQSTFTFISESEYRDALIMEEIRRKIEDSFSGAKSFFPEEVLFGICQNVTADLAQRFYSKGVHPLYYPKTGIALLKKSQGKN